MPQPTEDIQEEDEEGKKTSRANGLTVSPLRHQHTSTRLQPVSVWDHLSAPGTHKVNNVSSLNCTPLHLSKDFFILSFYSGVIVYASERSDSDSKTAMK